MTYYGFLWRLRSSAGSLAVVAPEVHDRLAKTAQLFHPSSRVETESGDLMVSFFARAVDARSAISLARSVMEELVAALPQPDVEIKNEWAGIVTGSPDPANPGTFPAIPDMTVLSRRRTGQTASDPHAIRHRVRLRVTNVPQREFESALAYIKENMRKMRRLETPNVRGNRDVGQFRLEFSIGARTDVDAKRRAMDVAEALISGAIRRYDDCHIEIEETVPLEKAESLN